MLSYREIPPEPRAQSIIQSCWMMEHTGETTEPQRVVPDGHAELILNLGQPFEVFGEGRWQAQPRCFLAGQIDSPLFLRPNGPARIIGIRFHPHSASQVFGAAMHQLAGTFTPLDHLSPVLARACDEAIASPQPDLARIQAALQSTSSISRCHDRHIAEAVRRITSVRGAVSLAALARDLGLSVRQFERRFLATVGLPPKLFCRMQRFVDVFRVVSEPGPADNWVDAALACGYYDQSHLIRDFRQLAGETPAALLAPGADLARHFLERFEMSHSSKTSGARFR